jgi:signal transduction histidine kinase
MYLAKRKGAGKAVFHGTRIPPVGPDHPSAAASPAGAVAQGDLPGEHHEPALAELREANGALVRAAIGAQQLQGAAELALRKQKEYLACVAHELRNPLAPLSVAVSLLRGGDPACQVEMQGIIERQVTHMSRLVGDLLDLSRGETGKLRIHPREVDLVAIVEDAVRAIRPSIEARRQKFVQTMPAQSLPMVADPVRMVQILSNLLDNASKYTPRGGEILLSAEVRDGEVHISVSDNGIGVSPKSLAAVFEPFAQEPHAAGFSGKGLGIGLTVVRELVHLHGGRVVASSDGTGKGSQFTVTLPLAGHPTSPAA